MTDQVTSPKDWKKKSTNRPLELPSGNTALVRAPGLQVFIEQGFIPNSLMPIVSKAIKKGKPPKMDELTVSKETLTELVQMADEVCLYCVVEPPVNPVPKDEEGNTIPSHKRDEDTLYVDEVDMEDKMFIFQFAMGGTANLERFRKGLEADMDPLPTS